MKDYKAKKFAQEGCKRVLGFAPSLEQIEIVDKTIHNKECQFVAFKIDKCNYDYSYDGYTLQFTKFDIVRAYL